MNDHFQSQSFHRSGPASAGIIWRLALSAIVLIGGGLFTLFANPVSTLRSGQLAGGQLANSDSSAISVPIGLGFYGYVGLSALIVVILLACIWLPFVRNLWRGYSGLAIAAIALAATAGQPARAFYDKTDSAEAVFILPNESAFFVPDVGANKDSQVKYGSEEYLNQNKVAAKRFQIPHDKFKGSGGTYSIWSDFYVPTGRLIIVDRTPYNREWTAASSRGTSSRNESFPCQSAEGLNMTAEVAIAASVSEENVAKFLYYFGVNPPVGDRSRPEVIFTSVYYGKSLAQVMDTVGRGKVQSIVCREFSARTFDDGNKNLNEIMDHVEKNVSAFLDSRGITLDYIGWAGTITFDKDIQQAVNDRYSAEHLGPVMPILQQKIYLDLIASASSALGRWDGKLPQQISGLWIIPNDLAKLVTSFAKGVGDAPAK